MHLTSGMNLRRAAISVFSETFFGNEPALFHHDYPNETVLERAVRMNILDVWTPEVYFKVTANAGVIFTGEKATTMYAAWNAKIFGGKKTQQ